jgi:anti-sigma regulatory factor (Ser/Thr protein kinase)
MLTAICRRLDALSDTVRVTCACGSPVILEVDRAIPLALITSELITNALRHAYDGKQEGEVHVAAGADGCDLLLTVRDFGTGFDAETRRPGLGSRVTGSMATKIGCTLHTQSRPGEGTCVTVRMRAGGGMDSPASGRLALAPRRKHFFFEKKKQKTFEYFSFGLSGEAEAQKQKFFGSFFQKRTSFLLMPILPSVPYSSAVMNAPSSLPWPISAFPQVWRRPPLRRGSRVVPP